MTTDSQFEDCSYSQFHSNLLNGKAAHTNELTGAMDMVKRDRFELLSAYLDGEVTAAERKQVEEWLANDPSVQRLHNRLLKLRQSLRHLPVPTPQQPVEATVEQVLARARRRYRLAWVFGGTAIAACVLSAVSGLIPGNGSRIPQLAQKESTEQAELARSKPAKASPLMVAINNPIIPIPKAAEAAPDNPVNQLQPLEWDFETDIN